MEAVAFKFADAAVTKARSNPNSTHATEENAARQAAGEVMTAEGASPAQIIRAEEDAAMKLSKPSEEEVGMATIAATEKALQDTKGMKPMHAAEVTAKAAAQAADEIGADIDVTVVAAHKAAAEAVEDRPVKAGVAEEAAHSAKVKARKDKKPVDKVIQDASQAAGVAVAQEGGAAQAAVLAASQAAKVVDSEVKTPEQVAMQAAVKAVSHKARTEGANHYEIASEAAEVKEQVAKLTPLGVKEDKDAAIKGAAVTARAMATEDGKSAQQVDTAGAAAAAGAVGQLGGDPAEVTQAIQASKELDPDLMLGHAYDGPEKPDGPAQYVQHLPTEAEKVRGEATKCDKKSVTIYPVLAAEKGQAPQALRETTTMSPEEAAGAAEEAEAAAVDAQVQDA
jgi:hypothetical protein